jgi:hypothetical protein
MSEDELDTELQERLLEADHQQYTDDAVNAVLLLAAQAELTQLRSAAAAQQPRPEQANSLYHTIAVIWVFGSRAT